MSTAVYWVPYYRKKGSDNKILNATNLYCQPQITDVKWSNTEFSDGFAQITEKTTLIVTYICHISIYSRPLDENERILRIEFEHFIFRTFEYPTKGWLKCGLTLVIKTFENNTFNLFSFIYHDIHRIEHHTFWWFSHEYGKPFINHEVDAISSTIGSSVIDDNLIPLSQTSIWTMSHARKLP